MMYGCFIFATSLVIDLASQQYPGIFQEQSVSFWRILSYTLDVGLRGFAEDIMEWVGVPTVLTPVGGMYRLDKVLKIIMAATIVSGVMKYYDLTKGKGRALPP